MLICLNGDDYELEKPCSVRQLLDLLGMGERPVVVELNGKALLPREFPECLVHEGDRVEIVSIVAGG